MNDRIDIYSLLDFLADAPGFRFISCVWPLRLSPIRGSVQNAVYASNNARLGISALPDIRCTAINARSACAVWHFAPKRQSKSRESKK